MPTRHTVNHPQLARFIVFPFKGLKIPRNAAKENCAVGLSHSTQPKNRRPVAQRFAARQAPSARAPEDYPFHLNLLVASKFYKTESILRERIDESTKIGKKILFPLNKKFCLGKISFVPPFKNKNSVSAEDYLERIHELIDEKGYARAVDIANALGISQSSVSSMVQKLAAEGLLNYEKYRGMTLTKKGKRVALAVHKRHEILKRFLSLLKVPQKAQERDIEGLEHHISRETVRALAQLSDDLEIRAGKG